jgi:hypothetical protein
MADVHPVFVELSAAAETSASLELSVGVARATGGGQATAFGHKVASGGVSQTMAFVQHISGHGAPANQTSEMSDVWETGDPFPVSADTLRDAVVTIASAAYILEHLRSRDLILGVVFWVLLRYMRDATL